MLNFSGFSEFPLISRFRVKIALFALFAKSRASEIGQYILTQNAPAGSAPLPGRGARRPRAPRAQEQKMYTRSGVAPPPPHSDNPINWGTKHIDCGKLKLSKSFLMPVPGNQFSRFPEET